MELSQHISYMLHIINTQEVVAPQPLPSAMKLQTLHANPDPATTPSLPLASVTIQPNYTFPYSVLACCTPLHNEIFIEMLEVICLS